MASGSRKAIGVALVAGDHRRPKKWRVSLGEDVFGSSTGTTGGGGGNFPAAEGSIFNPMLFGSFFDPADEFPLWEFDQESLLCGLPPSACGKNLVSWDETEDSFGLRAHLPSADGNYDVEVCIESGKVIEISKQWKKESSKKDWRTGRWWEYGHVRRLELPPNANGPKTEAYLDGDAFLEIRIPKRKLDGAIPESSKTKD